MFIEYRENRNIKIASERFENVVKFKYFAATLTYKNCTHREIKSRVNSENACDHSGQKLLYSRLLPKDIMITIYIEYYLTFVLYRRGTWFLISREGHRLSTLENSKLTKIIRPKGEELTWFWRILHSKQIHDAWYLSRDQFKETVISAACGTHRGEPKCIQGSCWET